MFCDPNILRHDSDSSSKGATSGSWSGHEGTASTGRGVGASQIAGARSLILCILYVRNGGAMWLFTDMHG